MTDEKDTTDQGFNDAELEDIMNEIESLEKDFDMSEPAVEAIDPIAEELGDIGEPIEVAAEPVMEEPAPVVEESPEPVMEEVSPEPVMEEPSAEILTEAAELLDETPMNSIDEELEKAFEDEFESNHETNLDLNDEAVSKTELQGVIDSEVDELLKDREVEMVHEDPAPMEMEIDNVVEMAAPEHTPVPVPTGAPAETQMSFSMSGNATIKLNFEFAGQKVALHVNEEDGFTIEMDGGAKFSIPVVDKAQIKKAS